MTKNYSIKDAAIFLGISVRGVHRHATNDPTFPIRSKIGRKTVFNKTALEIWMEQQRSH